MNTRQILVRGESPPLNAVQLPDDFVNKNITYDNITDMYTIYLNIHVLDNIINSRFCFPGQLVLYQKINFNDFILYQYKIQVKELLKKAIDCYN